MKIRDIRIRNFRSIEAEQHIQINDQQLTIVGPNNSGKTNILRAIQMFFTGSQNIYNYNINCDLTFEAKRSRTSISISFEGDPKENKEIYDDIDELYRLQNRTRDTNILPLTVYFTETNTPVYNFFPNIKRPQDRTLAAQFSRIHIDLVKTLLEKFSLHYVPSAKSVKQIYLDLILPLVKQEVAIAIKPHFASIDSKLKTISEALNKELHTANLSNYHVKFSVPDPLESLLLDFNFTISDPTETSIYEKGMGIQTTALLAAFRWITQKEKSRGKEVIWLLEEPESYLHPHLASNCNILLGNLGSDATVIKTTHSLTFVPQHPNQILGTKLNNKNYTEFETYKTFTEAIKLIRSSLGIKFSDFYNLAERNIFVEGPSDRAIFLKVLDKLDPNFYPYRLLRSAKFEDFGGVKHLGGFLRATWEFIYKERACVTVFDSDQAGDKERKSLQSFFGEKKIPFQMDTDFIMLKSGFPIEGLFPDEWIKEIYNSNPSWFSDFALDIEGKVQPFTIADTKKSNFHNQLFTKIDNTINLDWANLFIKTFEKLECALEKSSSRISEKSPLKNGV